jgi:hypothetical protein
MILEGVLTGDPVIREFVEETKGQESLRKWIEAAKLKAGI